MTDQSADFNCETGPNLKDTSTNRILECIRRHGWDGILKARQAFNTVKDLDITDDVTLQFVSTAIGIDLTTLRSLLIDVVDKAPCLVYAEKFQGPLLLMPPTACCIFGCTYKIGHKEGLPVDLHGDHPPKAGVLFDISGNKQPVNRQTLVCQQCKSRYLYDMVLNSKTGKYYFYNSPRQHVRVSQNTFWTRRMCNFYVESIQHCRATYDGFTETFKEAYGLDRGFNRKQTSELFFRYEIENELRDKNLEFGFSKSTDLDEILPLFNKLRCDGLYPHTCSTPCQARGCGGLSSADGFWGVTHPYCEFTQDNVIQGITLVNYPRICPEQPQSSPPGSLFCEKHSKVAVREGIPTSSRQNIAQQNTASFGLQGTESFLSQITSSSFTLPDENDIPCSAMFVDLAKSVASPKRKRQRGNNGDETFNPKESFQDKPHCSKNLGVPDKPPTRSRGLVFIVRARGHVDMFAPIYGSESPSQVFLIVITWLYAVLQNINRDEWNGVFLAYDNMCHLNSLRASKNPLPLPSPYDLMWCMIGKIIDTFHLGNHVGYACKTQYNPQQVGEKHPELKGWNTQCAEETFAWLRQYKNALNSMPKYHQLFFLHRLIKRRNKYLEKTISSSHAV